MSSSVPAGGKFGGGRWRRLVGRWRPAEQLIFGGVEGVRAVQPGPEAEVEALARAILRAETDDSVPVVRLIDEATPEVRRLVAAFQRARIDDSEVA
jgi:hypothetical protein